MEEANAVGFPGSSYPNTYNQLWKNQSNFGYENANMPLFQPQPNYMPGPERSQCVMPNQNSNSALEAMMHKLVDGQLRLEQEQVKLGQVKLKFEQETRAEMRDMRNQIGQLASSMNRIEAQISNKLPSQPVNPRESVNVITLRSGKSLNEPKEKNVKFQLEVERETEVDGDQIAHDVSYPLVKPKALEDISLRKLHKDSKDFN